MSFTPNRPPVVIDASVAIHLAIGSNPAVESAWIGWLTNQRMLLTVPHFWPEVASALLWGLRLAGDEVHAILDELRLSGVEIADRGRSGLLESVELAGHHGLTVYDALYLQLALDVDGSLATFDHDVAAAATREGVPLEILA